MADKPFNNPFAALGALKDKLAPAEPQVRSDDFPEVPPTDGPALALIQVEARAGREVTIIDGLGLSPAAMEEWRLALQRGLGTRIELDRTRLVIEGDHRFKLPDLLLRRGVKRIQQK